VVPAGDISLQAPASSPFHLPRQTRGLLLSHGRLLCISASAPVLIERWSYLPPEHVVLRMDTRRLGEILVKVLYEGGPPFHADFHTRVTGGRM